MSGSEGRFPKSLIEFQGRFATESACAAYLSARRWPQGFVCPGCGERRAWLLKAKLSNGISALQLQSQLGLGSSRTAWILCATAPRPMVNPHREPPRAVVD